MKKIITTFSILVFCLAVFSSCKKYLDINQNPNSATEAPISGLLANTTYNTAYNVFNASNITSYYVQYLSSPNPGSDIDIYNNIDPSGTWSGFYNIMTDLHDMKALAVTKGSNAYEGVADILMALHLNMASNLWGDVPYSQSFMGVSNLTPVFDNQQDVYDTAMKLLDEGIAALGVTDPTGGLDENSDFIHAGSVTAWIKTAHALKARMLTQVSKTGDYNADAVLTELAAAYTSNDDDAQVSMFENRNPWAQVAVNNAGLDLDGWLSSYFVNAANGATYSVFDPRLPLITDTTQYGDYRGTPNGQGRTGTGTENKECYLSVGGWYSSDNSPLQIITYVECLFMKAEAELRNSDNDAAYTDYLNAITFNMQKMGVADTAITRYTSDPAVAVGSANLTLQLIMKEKYIGCFLSPVTWDDMRRFDYNYVDFELPVGCVLGEFIRRTSYPTVEISANGGNVPDVTLTDHLWWDQ
ncbi:MAG: SusD/RagB family nutrient-binding outer membrane lipoprotein [Bacteroidetes bacterium]|nr:SusD/RagB family nutrient-binding outer membrane lipoprotein [Bacteroidota bacterium]